MSALVFVKFEPPLAEDQRDDLMCLLWARGVTEFEISDNNGHTGLRLNPRQARDLDEGVLALLRPCTP